MMLSFPACCLIIRYLLDRTAVRNMMVAYWDRLDKVKDIIKSDFGSPRAPSYSLVLHGTLRRTYVQSTLLAPTSKLVGISLTDSKAMGPLLLVRTSS